jgi:hypothetical protein
MAAGSRGRQNRCTMEQRQPNRPEPKARPAGTVFDLNRLIDERDETIRLLNAALSQALDELDRAAQAA